MKQPERGKKRKRKTPPTPALVTQLNGLGPRLKAARLHHQLVEQKLPKENKERFARDTGIDAGQISRAEQGRAKRGGNFPELTTLVPLADTVEVSLDYLACRVEEDFNLWYRLYQDKRMTKEKKEALLAFGRRLLKQKHFLKQ